MTTKFYLHNATTSDTGTLPAAGASVSATTPSQIASGTNRSMDGTIGTAQASVALTTLVSAAAQPSLIARFLSAPLAAQTITAAATLQGGASESSVTSAFVGTWVLAVWRPSTGSVVGRLLDLTGGSQWSSIGTTETNQTSPQNGVTSQTAVDGDVLVLEIWRNTTVQAMSAAFTNTVFFDGTTEGSATTNAAYLLFASDVPLYVPPVSHPIPTSSLRQMLAHCAPFKRRRSGLWAPPLGLSVAH